MARQLQKGWRVLIVMARQWAGPVLRFHLALFYLHGLFYNVAKRFTGVRYIFGGRLLERRPSYSILGILLFVQLSLSAGGWFTHHFRECSVAFWHMACCYFWSGFNIAWYKVV